MTLTLTFIACNSQRNEINTTDNHAIAKKIAYICPMHSEMISNKPGKCPICRMEMVEKSMGKESKKMDQDSIKMINQPDTLRNN
jgi:hypothetical protein